MRTEDNYRVFDRVYDDIPHREPRYPQNFDEPLYMRDHYVPRRPSEDISYMRDSSQRYHEDNRYHQRAQPIRINHEHSFQTIGFERRLDRGPKTSFELNRMPTEPRVEGRFKFNDYSFARGTLSFIIRDRPPIRYNPYYNRNPASRRIR
jgi:hypothetical protein